MKRIRIVLAMLGVLSLALLLGGAPAVLAQANGAIQFQNVYLWVNPEYDNPGPQYGQPPLLLVMMEGNIVGAPTPAEVEFLVPHAAEMYSAGSMDAQGKYLQGISKVAPTGGAPDRIPSSISGWDEISYQAQTSPFRVEYYDPAAIQGQANKTISYDFRTLIPISNLTVVVQQPISSSNFTVTPAGYPTKDSEGFSAQLYHFDNVTASTPIHFQISYTKTDPRPSVEIMAAESKSGNGNTFVMIVLVLVAAVLAGGGVFLVSKLRARAARSRVPATSRIPARGRRSPSALRFCPQCGQRLEHPSRFCPHCGANLE